jgi:hypothetical protein
MTTRERKIRFLECGYKSIRQAVYEMLFVKGPDWLTDEQIDDLTSKCVSDWRFTQHFNMRNRKRRGINDHSRMD